MGQRQLAGPVHEQVQPDGRDEEDEDEAELVDGRLPEQRRRQHENCGSEGKAHLAVIKAVIGARITAK